MSGYGFRQVARMEWIKLRTVRSTWWLCAVVPLAMVAVGGAVAAGYRSHRPVATAAQLVNNGLAGAVLGQLLIGALGVLVVTGEYSSGLIKSTLAAVPRRGLVLVAKATVFGGAALLVGEAGAFAGYAASQLGLVGSPVPRAGLGDPGVLRTVLLTGLYLALIGLLGVGVGTVVRHPGGAIGALFGVLFVPLFLGAALGEGSAHVLRYVPMFLLVNSIAVLTPVNGMLNAWAGIGVIALYPAAALGLGAWLLRRRDA